MFVCSPKGSVYNEINSFGRISVYPSNSNIFVCIVYNIQPRTNIFICLCINIRYVDLIKTINK